ncbi:hypothetical protein FB106_102202 [Synechococcus sp. Ace-Pa]|nr:hypothetical protein BM449_10650 [Synechococcus sp. SynAce01]TWB95164.1 hypothetical protein FB106_102202 [Synechococcus sp. Ace-Pa]
MISNTLHGSSSNLPAKESASSMSATDIPAVVEFSAVYSAACASTQTPAGLVEAMMPIVSKASWLLITSNSLICATEDTTLTMILERSIPLGVDIALDVAWQPSSWDLEPGSKPTHEILRRFHHLAQEATLIHSTPEEAVEFFSSQNPLMIHRSLSHQPGVVITGLDGSVDLCLGGRTGTMGTHMLSHQDNFFKALIECFVDKPELLGNAGSGPGTDAMADPDGLTDALLAAATK